jgi:hypothetical protein
MCYNTKFSRVASIAISPSTIHESRCWVFSSLFQTWSDADVSVESLSTIGLSTTVQCWFWNMHVWRCQLTSESSIVQYGAWVSGLRGSPIVRENVADDHELISQSAVLSLQLFYTKCRLGSSKSKESIDTKWVSIFYVTQSNISFCFIQWMEPVTLTVRWTGFMGSSSKMICVGKGLSTPQSRDHHNCEVVALAQLISLIYAEKELSDSSFWCKTSC